MASSNLAESAIQNALIDRLTKADLNWRVVASGDLPRQPDDVLLESEVSAALERLNPVIAERQERVEEVLRRLRAVLLSPANDGLVAANEEMVAWLAGRKTVRFPETDDYIPVRFMDFDDPRSNSLLVSTEVTYSPGREERRFDLVLWINGFPLVIGETKTPISFSTSWLNGARDIHLGYELKTPGFFVPNVLSFSTEGKEFRCGAIRQLPEEWQPWSLTTDDFMLPGLRNVIRSAELLLRPELLLEILRTYTLYSRRSSTTGGYVMKVIPRYPQVEAVDAIVARVRDPRRRKVREGGGPGVPIMVHDPDSPLAQVYRDVASHLAAQVSIRNFNQASFIPLRTI